MSMFVCLPVGLSARKLISKNILWMTSYIFTQWSEWVKIVDNVHLSPSSLGGSTVGEVCRRWLHIV